MASPTGKYSKYDEFIPVLTNDNQKKREDFMCLPLFLHQLEENYNSSTDGSSGNARIAFRNNVYYPIADAVNLKDSTAPKGTVSQEFFILIGNITSNLVDITDGSQVAKATELAGKHPWFKEFLKIVYVETTVTGQGTQYKRSVGGTGKHNHFYFSLNMTSAFSFADNTWFMGTDCLTPGGMPETPQMCWNRGLAGPSANKYLTTPYPYMMTKYLLTTMLEDSYKAVVSSTPYSADFFSSSSSNEDEKFYFRKPEDPTKLYKMGADGKGVEIDFTAQVMGNNCFNLGFVGTGPADVSCQMLVTKCLNGKDVATCKEFMADKDWWNKNTDVKDLDPNMGVTMLEKFGFTIKSVDYNSIGLQLKQFESPSEWINNLSTKYVANKSLTEAEVEKIARNETLLNYLEQIVNKINKNPAVLNKNYTGSDSVVTNPFAGTMLSKYGVKPRRVNATSGVPSVSAIIGLQTQAMNQRLLVAPFYNMVGVGSGLVYQRGGSHSGSILDKLPMSIAPQMKMYFDSFVSSLKTAGKDLEASDKAEIYRLIAQLTDTEEKLRKSVVYTEKYTQLLSVFGTSDESSVLNFKNIQKFVDTRNKSFQKVSDRQTNLGAIILAVAEAVRTELAAGSV